MKTKLSLWVFLLFSALFVSCNQDQDCESSINVKRCSPENQAASEENTQTLEERYEGIDVQEYLDSYPDIFGDEILIFNDLDEVDLLLGDLANMDFNALRTWYNGVGIHNDIIESNIIYDSVLNKVAEQCGIQMNDDYEMSDGERSSLYTRFVEKMSEEYPEMCSTDETYGAYANPLGNVDDVSALSNEKGLVIIDKVVYKYQQGCLLSCPIDKFVNLPIYDDIYEFAEDYEAGAISGFSEDDIAWGGMIVPQEHYVVDNINSHVIERGDYKLSVYLTAYPVWRWFNTDIRGKVIVTNYYRNSKCRMQVNGHAEFYADVQTRFRDTETYDFFLYEHWDAKYKSRTFYKTRCTLHYSYTLKTYVTLHDVAVSLTQNPPDGIHMTCNH